MAKSNPTTRPQHYWRVRKFLPERFGEHCRPIVFGKMNSVLVEFLDGVRYITGRYNIRRLPGCPPLERYKTKYQLQPSPRTSHRTLKEICWLAGLVEGEGCFPKNAGVIIALSMTDEDVVRKAAQLFGAQSVYARAGTDNGHGYKTQYTLHVRGPQAIGWMFTLYTLLGARRRARIREVIHQWKATQPQGFRTHKAKYHCQCSANYQDPACPLKRRTS